MEQIIKFLEEKEFDHLFFLGDIHGEWDEIYKFFNNTKLVKVALIQVGDFAIGYKSLTYERNAIIKMNEFLEEYYSSLFIIRGNHDNPEFFRGDKFGQPRIHFLQDYTILTLNINSEQKNIFCLGGAVSIDRKPRQEGLGGWWFDEVVNTTTNMSVLNKITDINIIVTHTSPDFAPPFVFNHIVELYCKNDVTLKADLIGERSRLTSMIDYLIGLNKKTLTHAFYGHFHYSDVSYYKDVKFTLLGINEFVHI